MANKFHNPKSVALAGKYSLGCEIAPGARVLFVAGQVGLDGSGKLADGIEAQCDQVWKNIGEVLKAADMGYGDIVKITSFLTDSRFIAAEPGVARQGHQGAVSRLDPADHPGPRRSGHAGRDRGRGREVAFLTAEALKPSAEDARRMDLSVSTFPG